MPNKKITLPKKDLSFFKSLIDMPSPTGFESKWQHIRTSYIKRYVDDIYVDSYGTAVGIINPKAKYKVVIEAHCDEISRFVNYITDDGYIHVIRNGGSDHMIAPSQRVLIHTNSGDSVPGVIWRPAIHTRRWEGMIDDIPQVKQITIDVCAKDKKAVLKMGINIGDTITYDSSFQVLNKKRYTWRAMDNRVGGFMIAQVARLLKQNKKTLPFWLYIVNSVQEEIGLRWAEMIAEWIKPDIAIVTDVCHDTGTPMISKQIEWDTICGSGPVLTVWPAVQNNVLRHIQKTAKKNKIPVQMNAVSYFTGTDTDAFAYSNQWVPSALISLATRYMHSTVETVHHDDICNTIDLIYKSVLAIKNGKDWGYDILKK